MVSTPPSVAVYSLLASTAAVDTAATSVSSSSSKFPRNSMGALSLVGARSSATNARAASEMPHLWRQAGSTGEIHGRLPPVRGASLAQNRPHGSTKLRSLLFPERKRRFRGNLSSVDRSTADRVWLSLAERRCSVGESALRGRCFWPKKRGGPRNIRRVAPTGTGRGAPLSRLSRPVVEG